VESKIIVTYGASEVNDIACAILVPEAALDEPGYIKTFTVQTDAHSKHEFHAMAQMVYYQYEDEELDITELNDIIIVTSGQVTEQVERGMVIYRDVDGAFHVLIDSTLNQKKMLETTNRYCTRWVRLDI
jgi:hypothetical protein